MKTLSIVTMEFTALIHVRFIVTAVVLTWIYQVICVLYICVFQQFDQFNSII